MREFECFFIFSNAPQPKNNIFFGFKIEINSIVLSIPLFSNSFRKSDDPLGDTNGERLVHTVLLSSSIGSDDLLPLYPRKNRAPPKNYAQSLCMEPSALKRWLQNGFPRRNSISLLLEIPDSMLPLGLIPIIIKWISEFISVNGDCVQYEHL